MSNTVQFVNTKCEFDKMLKVLTELPELAIDAEGVNLGRTGPLTILSVGGIDASAPVYVVDVQTLGKDIVFAPTTNSLKTLLEDESIVKVSFDCRNDSDALFHQFNVVLAGVLELQVLDQAVRIQRGETPPQNCPYVFKGQVQMLQGLETVATRNGVVLKYMHAPHKTQSNVWARRPLQPDSIAYAANDIVAIKMLCLCLRQVSLMPQLQEAVQIHSERYANECRGLQTNQATNKREEVAIVDIDTLPDDHAHSLPAWPMHMKGRLVWDRTRIALRLKRKTKHVFNDTLFVLQHDDWYTAPAYVTLKKWIEEYPHFTAKQRAIIECPPSLHIHDSDY